MKRLWVFAKKTSTKKAEISPGLLLNPWKDFQLALLAGGGTGGAAGATATGAGAFT